MIGRLQREINLIRNMTTTGRVKSALRLPAQYKELIAALADRIAEADARIYAGGMDYDPDKVRSENPVTLEDKIIAKADLERRAAEMRENYDTICEALKNEFRDRLDAEEAAFAKIYWIDGVSMSTAAKGFLISERTAWRWYKKIIKALVKTEGAA